MVFIRWHKKRGNKRLKSLYQNKANIYSNIDNNIILLR